MSIQVQVDYGARGGGTCMFVLDPAMHLAGFDDPVELEAAILIDGRESIRTNLTIAQRRQEISGSQMRG